MVLSPHHVADILFYVVFLLGQLVYIVKRAGFSMRAGRAMTRRSYVYQNWDILLFRSVLEFIFIYMPMRHFSPDQLLGLFHINLGSLMSIGPMQNPVSSPVSFLFAGIASDGIVDWLVDWASRSTKVPQAVKNWLTENVPPAPLTPKV